jgi:hypothetical protein
MSIFLENENSLESLLSTMFYNNQSTDIWNLSESTFGSPVISI